MSYFFVRYREVWCSTPPFYVAAPNPKPYFLTQGPLFFNVDHKFFRFLPHKTPSIIIPQLTIA